MVVEFDMSGGIYFIGGWVKAMVGILCIGITNKNTRLRPRLEFIGGIGF